MTAPKTPFAATRRSPFCFAFCAASLLLAACGSPASLETTITVDSAGVEIITSDPLRSDATCALDPEPVFAAGDDETDDAQLFTSLRGIARLSDGSVAVADRTSGEVRVFSETGEHLRSMGGRGEGPGEFRDPWYIWVLPGDTLWVGDYRPWRFNVFSPDGQVSRAVQLDPLYPNPSRGGGVLDDGTSVNSKDKRASRRDFRTPDTLVAEVHALDGTSLGTLARMPNGRRGTVSDGPPNLLMYPLFEPFARIDVLGTTIGLAHGSEPEVRVISADGDYRLRRILRWRDRDRAVERADVQAHFDRIRAERADDWRPLDDARVSNELPVNDLFPAIVSLLVGVDGRIWVRRYPRPRDDDELSRRWMVFAPSGDFQCHATLPERFSLYEAGADYVLGNRLGEWDVHQAFMYRVGPPGPVGKATP